MVELRDAELSLAQARLVRQGLEQTRAAELGALSRAMGASARRAPVLDDGWSADLAPPDADRLLSALPERRLDLIALRHRYRSHGAALDAERVSGFPPIRIGWFVNQEVDVNASTGPILSLGLPIFDRNQAQIARETTLMAQTGDRYAARLQQAESDVVALVGELTRVLEQVETARAAETRAAALVEAAQQALAASAITILELQRDRAASARRRAAPAHPRAERGGAASRTGGRVGRAALI